MCDFVFREFLETHGGELEVEVEPLAAIVNGEDFGRRSPALNGVVQYFDLASGITNRVFGMKGRMRAKITASDSDSGEKKRSTNNNKRARGHGSRS